MSLLHPKKSRSSQSSLRNNYPPFVNKYRTINFNTPQSKSLNGLNMFETIQLFNNLQDHNRLWDKVYNLHLNNKLSSSQWSAFDNLCEYYHRTVLGSGPLTPSPEPTPRIVETTPYRMPFGKFKDFPLRVIRDKEENYWTWLVYECDKTNWSERLKNEVAEILRDGPH